MPGLRVSTIAKQIAGTQNSYPFQQPPPNKSAYIQLRPSTERYRRLMALAEKMNMSYHRLALDILDWYLRTHD